MKSKSTKSPSHVPHTNSWQQRSWFLSSVYTSPQPLDCWAFELLLYLHEDSFRTQKHSPLRLLVNSSLSPLITSSPFPSFHRRASHITRSNYNSKWFAWTCYLWKCIVSNLQQCWVQSHAFLKHNGIWWAADEAVQIKVLQKIPEKSPFGNHKHIIGWSWGTPVERLDW